MNILLVEDDTAIAGALETFLTEKGCRVAVCPTLAGARELLGTALPDVVVLDWNLPDGAGADLCRELRQHRPGLPLLMLTVRNDTRDILAGFACGADDYVVLCAPGGRRNLAYCGECHGRGGGVRGQG